MSVFSQKDHLFSLVVKNDDNKEDELYVYLLNQFKNLQELVKQNKITESLEIIQDLNQYSQIQLAKMQYAIYDLHFYEDLMMILSKLQDRLMIIITLSVIYKSCFHKYEIIKKMLKLNFFDLFMNTFAEPLDEELTTYIAGLNYMGQNSFIIARKIIETKIIQQLFSKKHSDELTCEKLGLIVTAISFGIDFDSALEFYQITKQFFHSTNDEIRFCVFHNALTLLSACESLGSVMIRDLEIFNLHMFETHSGRIFDVLFWLFTQILRNNPSCLEKYTNNFDFMNLFLDKIIQLSPTRFWKSFYDLLDHHKLIGTNLFNYAFWDYTCENIDALSYEEKIYFLTCPLKVLLDEDVESFNYYNGKVVLWQSLAEIIQDDDNDYSLKNIQLLLQKINDWASECDDIDTSETFLEDDIICHFIHLTKDLE